METFFAWAILIPIVGIVWAAFIGVCVIASDVWKEHRRRKKRLTGE